MKRRRGGILAKLIVVVVIVYAAYTLINLQGQIENATSARETLRQEVYDQEAENEAIEYAIENRDDSETIERVARDRYNLVMPGERIFQGIIN